MMYPLVQELAAPDAPIRVAVTCRVLGFSQQAYDKWRAQPVSAREAEQAMLIGVLRELHEEDPEAGYRGLSDDLADRGYACSERRVWRWCHVAGIRSAIHDRKKRGPGSPGPAVHDDVLAYQDEHGVTRHRFSADRANQVWLTDIPPQAGGAPTSHWTSEGKLYLCAVKDVFSNRIVGYSIDRRMKAQLAVDALAMAITHRANPVGVIAHSDRGSQFRSRRYRRVLEENGLRGSMGRVGACGDNAAMESFFSLLQKNVLDRQTWDSRQQLRLAIVSWIEGKYHRKRRQRGLGKLTPIEYEAIMTPSAALAA